MNPWIGLKKLPSEIWILCFSTWVNRIGSMVHPFLVVYLTKALGYSIETAGAVLATYGAAAFFVGPISGRISDLLGAHWVMELSLISSGIVMIAFPLAHSKFYVFAMAALFAVTNEFFRPANLKLIGELAPIEHRRSAFGLSRFAINLGLSAGPAIGGVLAQISFPLLFYVDGLTSLMAAGVLIFTPFHCKASQHHQKSIQLKGTKLNSKGSRKSQRTFNLKEVLNSWRQTWLPDAILKDRMLAAFVFGIIPVFFVFFQRQSTLPLYLIQDLHMQESAYGLLFTLNTLMIVALELPLLSLIASWTHRLTICLGALLYSVGFGLLIFAHSYIHVALTVIVWTFGEMLLLPGSSAYISDIAPVGRQGEYMGYYMTSFSLAFFVGPWAGTMILHYYGSNVLWTAAFACGVLSTILLFKLVQRRRVSKPTL